MQRRPGSTALDAPGPAKPRSARVRGSETPEPPHPPHRATQGCTGSRTRCSSRFPAPEMARVADAGLHLGGGNLADAVASARVAERYAPDGMGPATSADEGPTQEKRDGEKSKHVDRTGVARRLLDGEVTLGSAHATSARHAGWARHSWPTQPWSVESRRLRQHAAGSLDGPAHRRARLPLIGATRQAGGGGWVPEPRASPCRPVAPLAGRRRAR